MAGQSKRQEPIYCILRIESSLGISYRMIRLMRRICPVREGGGTVAACVRYETYWYRVHPAEELLPRLREIRAEQYDGRWPNYTWRSFQPRKDESLPFILGWERLLVGTAE
jgi:hypothetical protein